MMGKVLFFVVLFLAVIYVFGDFFEENDARNDENIESDDDSHSRLKRQITNRLNKKAAKRPPKKTLSAKAKKNGTTNVCATTDLKGLQDTCCVDKVNDIFTATELQNCKIPKTESAYKFAFSAGYIKFMDSAGKVGYVAKSGWEKTIPAAAVDNNGDIDFAALKAGFEARASGTWNWNLGQIVSKVSPFLPMLKATSISKSATSSETVNVVSLFVQQVIYGMMPNVCGDGGKISESTPKYSDCKAKLTTLNKCDSKLNVQVAPRPPPTEAPAVAAAAAGAATTEFSAYQ